MPASPRAQLADALGPSSSALVDALPMGLYVVDRELRIVVWNRGRERGPLGRPRQRALGRSLSQVLSPVGFEATRSVIERVFETGEPHESIAEASGSVFHVRRLPLRAGRRVTHVVSCFEDITTRRELELRLISANRLAYLGQLVAGVAHEIANPLAGIAGCAEALASLAERSPGKGERREARQFRDLLRAEVGRAERIVRFLLDSAREGPTGTTDVAAAVSTALRLLERHPALARVRTRASLAKGLPQARVDADALRQVVMTLAMRGAEAMAGGGTLTLRLHREGNLLHLDVGDSGPPLAPAEKVALFEPYASPEAGAGLGLAIARSLMRRSGGDLHLRPRTRNTCFRVVLPVARGRR
jgi:two-component system NtrC family sensor kinase